MSEVDFVMAALPGRQAVCVDVSTREPPASIDFRSFFEREVSYVMRSLRRLGVADRDLEDVAHEVFLAVHARLATYDPSRPARPWLFAFALRFASHYRRAERREVDLSHVPEIASGAPSADVALEQDDKRRLLLAALDALDLDRRAVLILHELDGVACPDIARSLGIPLGTVYSRLRFAREDLEAAVRRLRAQRGLL